MTTKKFLEFNGKSIFFITKDGVYWIAIKPICEALGVDYIQQFKNIKKDPELSQPLCTHTIVAADKKSRQMICLPEFFIYGWLFSIKSESPGLRKYRWEAYEVLYSYFRGAMTRREELLKETTTADIEISNLKEKLSNSIEFLRIEELNKKKQNVNRQLKKLDKDIVNGQYDLWADLN